MTRNIYIGADVDIVLDAETQEEIPALVAIAFEDLKSTNFPSRAAALAEEIEKTMPHMIGLQEVSTFYTRSPGHFPRPITHSLAEPGDWNLPHEHECWP